VLGVGLLVRAVLMPLTYGGDFGMWSLTAAAAPHGQDTYSHPSSPIDRAGPYAYFPLYLYILLPLKWLAEHLGLPYVIRGGTPAVHTSLSYVILGKLPVVVGDVGVAVALAGVLRRAGLSDRACAVGAGLFFLNPLVLYNGPFYGRFDSLCLAALLLAWRQLEPEPVRCRRRTLWYALGVTLKTFPIFLLPYLVLRAGLRRGIGVGLAALALPLAVSLPYLLHNAHRFIYIVFVYDSTKGPRQFSWQFALLDLGLHLQAVKQISYVLRAPIERDDDSRRPRRAASRPGRSSARWPHAYAHPQAAAQSPGP
jgi:Gpi18-like mannosyltransferase